MKTKADFSVALVYDKVNTPFGGAEHVLRAIHEIFPDAPLYTSVYDQKKAAWAKEFDVKTSWLQKIPFFRSKHQFLAPLMPLAIESLDLSRYDVVISITSSEAKGVITKPEQLHICYLLTPTRYLYSHQEDYLDSHWFSRLPFLNQVARLLMRYLKWWDLNAASRPDHIIPISKLAQARTENTYQRKTEEVIYPPVPDLADNKNALSKSLSNYLLVVSRLVPYKRIDLAIKASLQTSHKLVVVGSGIESRKLKKLAGRQGLSRHKGETLIDFFSRANIQNSKILFTGSAKEEEISQFMAGCQALLMPGIEDFGITALQAKLKSKPVILHEISGAAELLSNTEAIFLQTETLEEMLSALSKLESFKFTAKTTQLPSFTALFEQKVYDLFRSHQLTVKKGQS